MSSIATTATSLEWYEIYGLNFALRLPLQLATRLVSQKQFLKGRKRYSCESDYQEDEDSGTEESDDGDGKNAPTL